MMTGEKFLRRFLGERRGAVAVQFALLLLPLSVLAFGVVDIGHANTRKRQVQEALDAATLAAARSNKILPADLQKIGEDALVAQLKSMSDATLISSSFTTTSPSITGGATVTVEPVIAKLWTNKPITVAVTSQVVRSLNKLEVVMVLDNTGSMASSSKLTNTKAAAKQFIDALAAGAARSSEPDAVKIGIVPFSTTVRLSGDTTTLNSYKTASWIDSTGAGAKAVGSLTGGAPLFTGTSLVNRLNLMTVLGKPWKGCVESRPAPYDVQDTAPNASTPATLIVPYFWPDEFDSKSKSGNKNANFGTPVNDYAIDLVYSTTNFKVPEGNPLKYLTALGSSTAGPNKGCDMEPITRLSKDWTSLKASVDRMVAVGETHVPVGMVWGWHLLSPNAPFADGKAYSDKKTTKIVVLMTDGDNTWTDSGNDNESDYSAYGYIWQGRLGITSGSDSARTTAMNNRLKTLCTNMKEQGIIVYTMGVMVSTSSKNLLKACASEDFYYDVTSSAAITTAFGAIAGSIDNLRISQ